VSATVSVGPVGTCTITASQAGNSSYSPASQSASFQVVNQAQTVSFVGTIANQTYGTQQISVSATASSTLPVTFSASPSNVCAVTGNIITLTGAGTCSITATQAGNATYGS